MRQRGSRRGTCTAAGLLVACGILAGVGGAGAAQQADQTITTSESGPSFVPANVAITTGDTVTWSFPQEGFHNAIATNDVREDPAWKDFRTSSSTVASRGAYPYTFTKPGRYTFVCEIHRGTMTGSVEVTGAPVEETPPPSETPTPTPTAQPTQTGSQASAAPPPDDRATPAPAGTASADRTAPAISGLRLKAVRRGARVTLQLSEPATVTLRFLKGRSKRVVRTARLQLRPGTRTFTVRGLERGRYTVELQARDAGGNTSAPLGSTLRIGRR